MGERYAELSALVAGVLVDLDGAGALADFLAENDREREAVLLRLRWKAWQKARARDAYDWREAHYKYSYEIYDPLEPPSETFELLAAKMRVQEDESFRDYIRLRFAGVRVEDVPYWTLGGCVVVRVDTGATYTACGSLILGGKTMSERPSRICGKCRKALTRMSLRPQLVERMEAEQQEGK